MAFELSPTLRSMLTEIQDTSKVAQALQSRLVNQDIGNYVSYASGSLTYLPAEAMGTEDGDDFWITPQRKSGRAARMARKLVREDVVALELTDQDFEIFANQIKAADVTETGTYLLVDGNDLIKWYNGRNYVPRNSGTLERSCMRYDECEKFFNIYTKNSDKVKMLVLINESTQKLYGRALIWYIDDETVIMDRIYGNDSVVAAFQQYAVRQGWLFRTYNRHTHETQFTKGGKNGEYRFTIPLTYIRSKYYPYMDTFKYMNKEEGWVSNDSRTSWDYQLSNQHGQANAR